MTHKDEVLAQGIMAHTVAVSGGATRGQHYQMRINKVHRRGNGRHLAAMGLKIEQICLDKTGYTN